MVASGAEGHVVNTSSGNGGISPLRGTPQYAVTKAAVVTLTECLYAQLQDAGTAVGASVLFPGPHMLRTGLFTSWRNRPADLAKERPRVTPYPTVEDIEAQMAAAGIEVALHRARGGGRPGGPGRAGRGVLDPGASAPIDAQIRARADSMLARSNPTYLRGVPGDPVIERDARRGPLPGDLVGLPRRAAQRRSTASGSTRTYRERLRPVPGGPGGHGGRAGRAGAAQPRVRRGVGTGERRGAARRLGRRPTRPASSTPTGWWAR